MNLQLNLLLRYVVWWSETSCHAILFHQILHRFLIYSVDHILIVVFIHSNLALLRRASLTFFMNFAPRMHFVRRCLFVGFVLDGACHHRAKLLERLFRLVLVKFHLMCNFRVRLDLWFFDRNVHSLICKFFWLNWTSQHHLLNRPKWSGWSSLAWIGGFSRSSSVGGYCYLKLDR